MSAEPIEVLFIDSSPIHSSGPLLYYVKEGDPYLNYIAGGAGGVFMGGIVWTTLAPAPLK